MAKKLVSSPLGKVIAVSVLVIFIFGMVAIFAMSETGIEGGEDDSNPVGVSVYDPAAKAGVASATVEIWLKGASSYKESLTSGGTGTVDGTITTYSTHETYEIKVSKSGYCTVVYEWTVPHNSKNLVKWDVPTLMLPNADASPTIDHLSGAYATVTEVRSYSTNDYTVRDFIKLVVTDEDSCLGEMWTSPDADLENPYYYSYVVVVLNETVSGLWIEGFTRADDDITFYQQFTAPLWKDSSEGMVGAMLIPLTIHTPATFGNFTVQLKFWSGQDPSLMQDSSFRTASLTFNIYDTATKVYS